MCAITLCLQADAELSKLQQEAKAEANRLTAVSAAPEKARRQADMAVAELQGAQALLASADSALLEAEAALRAAHDKERQKQVRGSCAGFCRNRTSVSPCLYLKLSMQQLCRV